MSEILPMAFSVLQTFAALLGVAGALAAVTIRWLHTDYRWHVMAGNLALIGFALLGLSWLGVGIARESMPLALAGLLTLYPAWSGWRHARRHGHMIPLPDRLAAWLLLLLGLGLFAYGTRVIVADGVLIDGFVHFGFGMVAMVLGGLDVRGLRADEGRDRSRIVNHLGMMLTASFAAVTSLAVTLAPSQLALVTTIATLFLVVHLIVYWSSRVLTEGVPDDGPVRNRDAHATSRRRD